MFRRKDKRNSWTCLAKLMHDLGIDQIDIVDDNKYPHAHELTQLVVEEGSI